MQIARLIVCVENQSWSGRGSLDACKTSWQTSLYGRWQILCCTEDKYSAKLQTNTLLARWQLQVPRWKGPNLQMSSQPAVYGLQYVVNHTDIGTIWYLYITYKFFSWTQLRFSIFAKCDCRNLNFDLYSTSSFWKETVLCMGFNEETTEKGLIQTRFDFLWHQIYAVDGPLPRMAKVYYKRTW